MIKLQRLSLLAALGVSLVAAPGLAQQSLELLPAQADDLVAGELVVPLTAKALVNVERQPVTFTWPLSPDQKLDLAAQPHQSLSRSYWHEVSAAELKAGVELPTVGTGAYIRINPLAEVDSAQLYAIDPMSLEITIGAGKALDRGAAIELMADADELKAAGTPFPAGTSAFKLLPELGTGLVTLRAPELRVDDETRYLVNVLERDSSVILGLSAGRDAYLSGQLLTASASLADGDQELQIESIDGLLTSPDGKVTQLSLSRSSAGSYQLQEQLAADRATGPGLWELQARVSGRSGKLLVQRDVRTAFGVALPTARFTGLVTTGKSAQELSARFWIEAAAVGRYEVRGVFFGTDTSGELRPLATSHTAAWLESGEGTLTLTVGADILNASTLRAPFEVRDLRLTDQSRMGLLHRQARGLVINR